ncbi:Xenotropic and polytropic retrovirus receptor 1-like protein [Smittium culicis]|uniref:Xenotropic and polytropic retrovirus receptor 1-like protein n=1 Tax=Smittium culicis TaxID=133412 RepID=A0A1R1X2Y6_9FUNG|nr:Xenotropic and polytropic retrovirus receptor 1-like protein [Smittium culicis]OMJ09003.1 Xenotropic and polytropic retrovirus receptor 1-like protein [Smittium culicis]
MKFGKYLESEAVPEWQNKYIDYKGLKKCIKRVDAKHKNSMDTAPILSHAAVSDYGSRFNHAPARFRNISQDSPDHSIEIHSSPSKNFQSSNEPSDLKNTSVKSLMINPNSGLHGYSLKQQSNSINIKNQDNLEDISKDSALSKKFLKTNTLGPLSKINDFSTIEDGISKSLDSIGYFEEGEQIISTSSNPAPVRGLTNSFTTIGVHPKRGSILKNEVNFNDVQAPVTNPTPSQTKNLKKVNEIFKKTDDLPSPLANIKKSSNPAEKKVVFIRRQSTRYNAEHYEEVYANINLFYEALMYRDVEERAFFEACDYELEKVNQFYQVLQKASKAFQSTFGLNNRSKSIIANGVNETLTKVATSKAKDRLKKAIMEVHRGMEMLKNYCILNHTGFIKILKKFNKTSNWKSGGLSYIKKVEDSYFLKDKTLNKSVLDLEELFRVNHAGGSIHNAKTILRMPLTAYKVYSLTFHLLN